MTPDAGASPRSSWIPMIVLAGVIMAGLGHAGCGDDSSSGGAAGTEPVHLKALYLNTNLVLNLQVNSSITLSATGGYSDGGVQAEPVTFTLVPAGVAATLVGDTLTGNSVGQATLTATSVAVPTVSTSITVNVVIGPPGAPSISTTFMNGGTVGQGYPTQQLIKSGGLDPVVWSVIAGGLPPGLSLNAASGVVSGTPQLQGLFNFTVKVRDSANATATKALSITIAAPDPSGSPSPSP